MAIMFLCWDLGRLIGIKATVNNNNETQFSNFFLSINVFFLLLLISNNNIFKLHI